MRSVLLAREEEAAGIRALDAMSWRAYIRLVLEAMATRGYRRIVEPHSPPDGDDLLFERDGYRWLLSCKHGSSFTLGRDALDGLLGEMRLANADGGILVTQGKILDEVLECARARQIELLDGRALWPLVRGLLKPEDLARVRARPLAQARQRTALTWALALALGAGVFTVLQTGSSRNTPQHIPRTASMPAASPAAPDTPASPASTEQLPVPEQRRALASALATLPMVHHALWVSESTLEVVLLDTGDDPIAQICPLVESYPEIANSRLQLTPPPSSGQSVRFRQCRAF